MDGGPGCENVKRFFVGKLNFWLIIFEKEKYAKGSLDGQAGQKKAWIEKNEPPAARERLDSKPQRTVEIPDRGLPPDLPGPRQ